MSESKIIDGVEFVWDTAHGKMVAIGRDTAAFWLDPSLLSMLAPLRDELGTELFTLLVANSTSRGTKEDYETMVTVFADTFEEGFLAWGRAVGVVGWGRFELVSLDRDAGTATVIVRSPWELVMQDRVQPKWGCPFMRGKLIGIFRYALGVNCWADERAYVENGEPVAEFSLFQSSMTIADELKRLRAAQATARAQRLQTEVDLRTAQYRTSEARLRATLSSMNSWVFTLDRRGRIQSHHVPEGPGAVHFPEDAVGRELHDVLPADAATRLGEAARLVLEGGQPRTIDYERMDAEERLSFQAAISPLRFDDDSVEGVTVVIIETTIQRRGMERQAQLEAQLRQAQKMEALGQLTGGVAHDFNNLLTAIYGNLELAQLATLSDDAKQCVDNALGAADSAAKLTHQLLAFSRRQPLQPHSVEPHKLVSGMEELLRRTLGERVDIEIVGAAGQWECEVDSAQLESAILNLAINSRDAMPNGGKITIETHNVRLSPEYTAEHEGLEPGQYVLVAVSDNGVGMSEETQAKAFEPFFTTKGPGHGSGLGLSMVYGFVKQSNGHIKIYSEPGVGTTVKLYLPRSTKETAKLRRADWSGPPPRGDGSVVLVVEDNDPVRYVSIRFLRGVGYETLDCATAEEAMQILASDAHVDLLFTDVVLPGEMNGAELARAAVEMRRDLAVLYTSGYTENAILHQGRLDAGVLLVEKPFTRDVLARRIHAALEKSRSSPRTEG